jgi:glutathione S-transferase
VTSYRLIGAEASYYTGKARAYLRWKGIPFEEVLATQQVYREIIIPRTGVRYIPVLLSPDDVAVQDTTDIIDFLEGRFPEPSVYPAGPVQRLVALLFETWSDEWLVLPAMHYRWSFPENRDFVLREFGESAVPHGTRAEQIEAGEKLSAPFSGALPLLGVTPRTIPAIEAWWEETLDRLSAHFAEQPFLLGTRPSIGDFGLMGPLYAHLGRDPVPARLMRERAPRVAAWVERMNAPEPRSGRFLADDVVPETLTPLLRRIVAEHLPVLVDTSDQLADWLDVNPGPHLPRAIGAHEFRVGGVTEQRMLFPYTVWMFQRVLDHYASLTGADRERADELLRALGGLDAMRTRVRRRVRRENNRLVAA